MKNFKYLDDLIHSEANEIQLATDIALDDGEEMEYAEGIRLDGDGLVIDGRGHSIDACRKATIFCNFSNVTLKNIVLKNGLRAIYNFKGVLNISDSILQSNLSEISGGAIYNYWGEVNISNSKLLRNVSECHGGAIFNFNGFVNLSGCELSDNTAKTDGGVIFNGSELDIADCRFKDNSCEGSGGAIYDNRGEINIKNSEFSCNSSKGVFGGGAIHKNRGILNVSDCVLAGNVACNDGGAIFAIDCEVILENSRVCNNSSSGREVYTKIMQDLVLKDCDFENNLPGDDL